MDFAGNPDQCCNSESKLGILASPTTSCERLSDGFTLPRTNPPTSPTKITFPSCQWSAGIPAPRFSTIEYGDVDIIAYDFVGEPALGEHPTYNDDQTGYNIRADSQLVDQIGIPGQNTKNPKSSFANHQWVQVKIGGALRWLDPSYGIEYTGDTVEDRKKSFEKAAVYGFSRGRIKDVEVVTQMDLNRDGAITSDDLLDVNDLWYAVVKRRDPQEIEGTFSIVSFD